MHQARTLFDSLRDPASVQGLVGTTETLHLEVKEGRGPLTDELKGYLSQALSGFANSDGGVLIFGLTAKGGEKGQPDQITALKPFEGYQTAASDAQSLLGQAVTPIVEGAEVVSFPAAGTTEYGYVVVYVPASDIGPHRAILRRIGDREYWKRAGDGFYRMEHFDIADMFGRRRRPRLRLAWEVEERERMGSQCTWSIIISLMNDGRSIARYPMLRLDKQSTQFDSFGLDGNQHEGLPRGLAVPSYRGVLYLGREGDIIHPGTRLGLTRTGRFLYSGPRRAVFSERFVFEYSVAAEDQPLEEAKLVIEPDELWRAVPPLFGHTPEK